MTRLFTLSGISRISQIGKLAAEQLKALPAVAVAHHVGVGATQCAAAQSLTP